MTYPIVTEAAARAWYDQWRRACMAADPIGRVDPEPPQVGQAEGGAALDWADIADRLVTLLTDLLASSTQADFESEGAVIVHMTLPDDPALRDPDFWAWLAIVPGRSLILGRYAEPDQPVTGSGKPPKNPLPGMGNFCGARSSETLFFRLWVRAEMSVDPAIPEPYEYVLPGLIDFWRSHVFRQLYNHHRPVLKALIDFLFPLRGETRISMTISTPQLRLLAKELRMACANLSVEALNEAQAASLVRRVYHSRVEDAAP